VQKLFTPLALGPTELQNRIVSTAHQTTLVHDHLPTDAFVAYHEARARGGVGLIVLEATAVHESGLLTSHTLGGYLPAIAEGYRRVGTAVQPHGTRLFVQLFHGGREQISTAPRPPAVAPSPIPTRRFRTEPRALREAEIGEIVRGYATGARLAAEGGLDGVEISAAHRYLIEQFFDPALNLRADRWRDGREFFAEVLQAVRAAAPDLCVGVRLSADSPQLDALADAAAAEGADYVSLALGDSSSYLGSVGIVPPPPIPDNAIGERTGSVAARLPRIITSRIVDSLAADELIVAGHADAVGMTRALITDPELPAKARAGRYEAIVTCIGCNACIAHYHAATAIACAVNPRTGRELDLPAVQRAQAHRRVAVVGAGPAGIAAALDAAGAGHEVVLFERGPRVGGQILLAGAAPGGRQMAATYLADAERRLADAGVELRLNTTAGPGDVEGADAVVLATGARPYRDAALMLEAAEVLAAWDVLAGEIPSSASVVVADWGGDPSGLDAAEVLAAAGKAVTLAVSSVAVGELVHQYRRNLYLQRLYRAGVAIAHHTELHSAANGGVTLRNVFAPDLATTVQAGCIVLALGRVPEDSLALELTVRGISFSEAGDCRTPRSLEEAVLEGTLASRGAVT
jgi:2,4-dienoyl-CoA reductase-like NADH-dependent reductase (Old Yellow Enzyme family)/thioredoxin reductase